MHSKLKNIKCGKLILFNDKNDRIYIVLIEEIVVYIYALLLYPFEFNIH